MIPMSIISARGLLYFEKFINTLLVKKRRAFNWGILIFVVLSIDVWSKYFTVYGYQYEAKIRNIGTREIAQYIRDNFTMKKTVVLHEKYVNPNKLFGLLAILHNNRDNILSFMELRPNQYVPVSTEYIANFEDKMFKREIRDILYVFNPGPYANHKDEKGHLFFAGNGNLTYSNPLLDLYPQLEPIKRIYSPFGPEVINLYRINKEVKRYKSIILGNKIIDVVSERKIIPIKAIKIEGNIQNQTITINNHSLLLPFNLSGGARLLLNFNKNSKLSYDPFYADLNDGREITVVNIEKAGTPPYFYTGPKSSNGMIIFNLSFPCKIDKIIINADPQIVNDRDGKNYLQMQYKTLREKEYKNIWKIESNGNGKETPPRERRTYNVFYPKAHAITFRILFSGDAKLYRSDFPLFTFHFDSSNFEKLYLKEGSNEIKLAPNSSRIKVYY